MHPKALAREAQHQETIAALKAKLRLRESQLLARKSEKNRNHPDLTITAATPAASPGDNNRGVRDMAAEVNHSYPPE